jgi:uncharacterized protein
MSPEELAARSQVIEVTVKLGDFGRLVEIAKEDMAAVAREKQPREWQAAPVNIRLGFAWADERGKIPLLEGSIETTVAAVCQRCLEPFEMPLRATLSMLLVKAADEAAGQDEFEIWEIEEDVIRPLDIVEEALIMALPFSAMHASGGLCQPLTESATGKNTETVRPFADLRSRMNNSNQ